MSCYMQLLSHGAEFNMGDIFQVSHILQLIILRVYVVTESMLSQSATAVYTCTCMFKGLAFLSFTFL